MCKEAVVVIVFGLVAVAVAVVVAVAVAVGVVGVVGAAAAAAAAVVAVAVAIHSPPFILLRSVNRCTFLTLLPLFAVTVCTLITFMRCSPSVTSRLAPIPATFV
jgi:hypothetical protein